MTDFTTAPVRVGDIEFQLVLPAESDDPVVAAYLRGEALNTYLSDLLQRFVPGSGTVLDLGCHVGTFSVAAAALGHRVVAVDASALHVEAVRRSAALNGFDDLTVVHAAVADRAKTVRFNENGLFGTVVAGAAAQDGSVEVDADSVTALLDRAGVALDEIAFAKMDIEGSELLALAGMATFLAGPSAPPVVYESNPMTSLPNGFSVDGLRTAFEVLGYRTYRQEEDRFHVCPPLEPQPEAWVDLIALKPGHLEAAGLAAERAWPREDLVERLVMWAALPHANVRAYVADLLARGWGDLGTEPRLRDAVARLATDEDPTVRAAIAPIRPPAPAPAAAPEAPHAPRPTGAAALVARARGGRRRRRR